MSAAPAVRPRWTTAAVRAAWVLAAVGSVLRLVGWLHDRSLWRDESSLAFNLLHRDFGSYTHPLALDQAAPLGFLGIEKAAIGLFGDSEQAMRLVPLLAGIATLVLAVVLVRRHLDTATGLIAVGLLALSPRLIYYSSELKQYSSDVLVVVVILLVTSVAAGRRFRGPALVGFLGLAVLPWLSFPAAFVLGGAGLTLVIDGARRRDRDQLRRVLGAGVVWVGSIGLLWLVQARSLGRNANLDLYWQYGFLPVPPHTSYGVELWQHSWTDLSSQLAIGALGTVVMLLAILGAVAMVRAEPGLVGFLVAPLAIAIVASSRHIYPFLGRVSLWTVPLLAGLVASGLTAGWRLVDERFGSVRLRWIALLPAVVLLVPIVVVGVRDGVAPKGFEELKPLVATLGDQVEPGDIVLVDHYSWPAFTYYLDQLDIDGIDARQVGGTEPPIGEQLAGVDGHHRVWVVSSGDYEGADVGRTLTDTLDGSGARVDTFRQVGAVLYLYDLAGEPTG